MNLKLVILLLLPLFGVSQTFEKIIKSNTSQNTSCLAETKQGYLISINGKSETDDDKNLSKLISIDFNGNLTNEIQYTDNDIVILNLKLLNDTVFLLFGTSTKQIDKQHDSIMAFYQLLNLDLQVIKQKYLPLGLCHDTTIYNITSKMFYDSAHYIYQSVSMFSMKSNILRCHYLLKTDTGLETIDTAFFAEPDGFETVVEDIVPFPGNDSALVFFENCIYIINNNLQIIDTLPKNFLLENQNEAWLQRPLTAYWYNNKLLVGGMIFNNLAATIYNSDLSVNDYNIYNFNNDEYGAYNRSFSINNDNIYFGGTKNVSPLMVYGYESSINLMKLNSDLSVKWDTLYKENDGHYYFVFDILATNDGGCLITSTRCNSENNPVSLDISILKVDSNGRIANLSSIADQFDYSFSLYPNPGNGHVTVNMPAEFNNAVVTFYNIAGVVQHSQTISNTNPAINVTNLPAGLYIYTIANNGIIAGQGKWVKN